MLRLEIDKLMRRKLVWLVLLGIMFLVLLQVFGYIQYHHLDKESHTELKREMQTLEKHKGILTDERLKEFFEDYIPMKINADYIQDWWLADGEPIPVVELFSDIGFPIHFGYFTQWVFSWMDVSSYIKYIPIFVAIAFASLFTYEKECGMQEILLSSRRGRRECTKAKVAAAFLITNLLYLLLAVLAVLPLFLLTSGKGWDSSLQMTPWMMNTCQLDMNYGEVILHTFYLGFVAVNVILLITLSASFLVKSPVVAMCVSLGVLFAWRPDVMTVIADNKIVNRITAMTPLNVIDTMNLAKQTPFTAFGVQVHWLFLAEALYTILLIGGGIFFFQVLTKQQKYYAS